eukprot:1603502-Pyramimonas_sp.AAC.1
MALVQGLKIGHGRVEFLGGAEKWLGDKEELRRQFYDHAAPDHMLKFLEQCLVGAGAEHLCDAPDEPANYFIGRPC